MSSRQRTHLTGEEIIDFILDNENDENDESSDDSQEPCQDNLIEKSVDLPQNPSGTQQCIAKFNKFTISLFIVPSLQSNSIWLKQ
jgi:hypothetical protein